MIRKFLFFKFYILLENFSITVKMPDFIPRCVGSKDGHIDGECITVNSQYSWDGASGISWDNTPMVFSSLVHDFLYGLIRENKIRIDGDPKSKRKLRKWADNLMYDINREKGMFVFRAWYIWCVLRLFGWMAIRKPRKVYRLGH